ncbi:MAG: HAD family hydrolase [Rhizomicrobium sp.]
MTIRIAMWSGPRNISTAMMRSFENRDDCAVSDEPFYAAYLAATGLDHPMREEVLASQPNDWRDVVKDVLGPSPGNSPIWYQKHMTQHMLPQFGRGWIGEMRNAFLIRAPEEVLASYTQKRGEVTLADIGFVQQREMFDAEADRLGHAPPVIEGSDVQRDPRGTLSALCAALGIPFSEKMLSWPAGRRDSDGVWAPAWYDAVEKSTGFAKPADRPPPKLSDELRRIADAARPHYERLAGFKLNAMVS